MREVPLLDHPKGGALPHSRVTPLCSLDCIDANTARMPSHTGFERISPLPEREVFIDNLLVRIHLIFVMIRWTGLAPWEFEFAFLGGLTPS